MKPHLYLARLVLAVACISCASPRPPKLVSARPHTVPAPQAELIVITDDGPIDAEHREITGPGSIVFLNEANTGPVTISVEGDYATRLNGDLPDGSYCLTVKGVESEADQVISAASIPRGSVVSTCPGKPGTYVYRVTVGPRTFDARLTVAATGQGRSLSEPEMEGS